MNGINHQDMNGTNKYLILKTIVTQGPITRGELCEKMALSKMAITAMSTEFIRRGIVRQGASVESGSGRRPTLLEVVSNSLLTLAIAVGRENLEVGIVNLKGEIIYSDYLPFSTIENNTAFLKNLFFLCDKAFATPYAKNFWGIGISSAGPLSASSGLILEPPNFNDIKNLAIAAALSKQYNLPAYLQNDMCVAALAEVYFGDIKQYNNFIFVGVSSGIGGGVIIDRKLYTGTTGLAGAIGHSIVEKNGIQCECGQKGCLEKYSGTRSVLKWAKENGADNATTWEQLTKKAAAGDSACAQAIDRMVDYLGIAITNMAIAYDTECFVIGGQLHYCKNQIIQSISKKLKGRSIAWGAGHSVQVRASSFAENASLLGAAALVMENNLSGDKPWQKR